MMCEYCREDDGHIAGKIIARTIDWKNTAGYNPGAFEQLEAFILKGKKDEKAGLIINTINGGRYIDINYCPMCGRKLGGKQ